MTQKSYPLNNVGYEAEDAQLFLCTRKNGVYSADNNLQVTANNNMTVTVSKGLAWLKYGEFKGAVYANVDNTTLTIPIADGILPRVDTVVIRQDTLLNNIQLAYVKGTPSANAKSTPPQRDDKRYEIVLAEIRVNAGVTSISQSNISDKRLDESVCGIMRDGVSSIPTQNLINQWQNWYNNNTVTWSNNFNSWYSSTTENFKKNLGDFQTTSSSDFDKWFQSVKDILNTNTSTQLTNEILKDNYLNIDVDKGYYDGDMDNGYTKMLHIKGKTLVNMAEINSKNVSVSGTSNPKITITDSSVRTLSSIAGSNIISIIPSKPFKKDTDYTFYFNLDTNITNKSLIKVSFKVGTSYLNAINIPIEGNDFSKGIKIRTPNQDGIEALTIGAHDLTGTQANNYINPKNIIILEGDYTNKFRNSYFQGIKNIEDNNGNLVFKSSNKNFANIRSENLVYKDSGIKVTNNNNLLNLKNISNNQYQYVEYSLFLKENTDYILKAKRLDNFGDKSIGISIRKKSEPISIISSNEDIVNSEFTTPNENGMLLRISLNTNNPQFKDLTLENIQIVEKSKDNGIYAFNVSDTLTIDSNLCEYDELYANKLIKKSEEYTFTENDNFVIQADKFSTFPDTIIFKIDRFSSTLSKEYTGKNPIICNRFNTDNIYAKNKEGILLDDNGNLLIRINKNRLASVTPTGFKQWIKNNETKIVYNKGGEETITEYPVRQYISTHKSGLIWLYSVVYNNFQATIPSNTRSSIESILYNAIQTGNNEAKLSENIDNINEDIESIKKSNSDNTNSVKTLYNSVTNLQNINSTIVSDVRRNTNSIVINSNNIKDINTNINDIINNLKVSDTDEETTLISLGENKNTIIKTGSTKISFYSDPAGKRAYFSTRFPNRCKKVIACGHYDDSNPNLTYYGLSNTSVWGESQEGFLFSGTGETTKWYSINWVAFGD